MSPTEPLVSIVVPAYNHAAYLDQAIHSVLAQDYPRVELIVLDDGSRDHTREVLARYGDRFHWESHPNMGQSATLAKGWAMARGEVLGYLSADDLLEPSAVREAVATLAAHPEAVATYCDFKLIDPQSRLVRRVTTPEFSYRDMLVAVSCPAGPGAFFRRAAYARTGPWNPALRQMPDYDFWLRLGLLGPFVRIPKVLAGFRVHEESQTYSRTSPERAAEPVAIVAGVLARPDLPAAIAPVRRVALANAHLVSAQLHLRAGRLTAGVGAVRQALACSAPQVFAPRVLRLLLNAAFNRLGHRLLWRAKAVTAGGQRSGGGA